MPRRRTPGAAASCRSRCRCSGHLTARRRWRWRGAMREQGARTRGGVVVTGPPTSELSSGLPEMPDARCCSWCRSQELDQD
ncbi:hypothetical protein NDU88_001852 [Pleurodeles waltl]|uniref:Uncharacterized protein n=1 Tax=Pleurodeles waltl TaxID=8319 RepID=A0AAV7UTX7_PLEWA|nr:hypothetical protein NDU88_001852 [Pleurodeles waltl]